MSVIEDRRGRLRFKRSYGLDVKIGFKDRDPERGEAGGIYLMPIGSFLVDGALLTVS